MHAVSDTRLALVTDFDGTLMEQDVGDELMEALGVFAHPAVREASARLSRREAGSYDWIQAGYGQLAGRQRDVDAVIERMHPRAGAAELFAFCRERGIPVTILSDGMEYYIRKLTAKFGLEPDFLIVNPIRYEADGSYRLGLQNDNEACRWCGCCKAGAVRRLKAEGRKVIYIGDGTSDVYGASFADWTFARGYLARYLRRSGIPAFPFETFHDVLQVLKLRIAAFEDGTMAGRHLGGGHPFCRFQ
jgi:2-hydroxy-3-keto-5-methylthiopentenyl-1-phosphate phosphatase